MQDKAVHRQTKLASDSVPDNRGRSDGGFSLAELMIVLAVMLTVSAAVFSLFGSAVRSSINTFELTDAQEGLRTTHEYLNRDLVEAGDGLQGITGLRVPAAFVRNYLEANPEVDATDPTLVASLPIVEDDDNVPANTVIPGFSPALNVAPGTDRITALTLDNNFTPEVSVAAGNISRTATTITAIVPSAAGPRFAIGEIYTFTSQAGAAFGVISNIINNGATYSLIFTNGDVYGINDSRTNGPIGILAAINGAGNSVNAASIIRMQVIHYFVDANNRLHRRVFGVAGGVPYRDSVVAEHIANLQFRYTLMSNGNLLAPSSRFTAAQQALVREVEATASSETAHVLQNGGRGTLAITTSISVRNLQFRTNGQLSP